MTVFVDTGYFLALMIPKDQWHSVAVKLAGTPASLITSSQVIGETISLLQMRGYFSLALEFLQDVLSDSEVRIIYPDTTLQTAAWDEFKRSGGFGANAVDCMSFAIMRKSRITRAYTFDQHFGTAGFTTAN